MNRFKIGEWSKFRDEFRQLFPDIRIIDLHDAWMSMANEYITIDIIAFGAQLEKMYPEEWDCMSMQDIVVKHYGAKAMQLIESVL